MSSIISSCIKNTPMSISEVAKIFFIKASHESISLLDCSFSNLIGGLRIDREKSSNKLIDFKIRNLSSCKNFCLGCKFFIVRLRHEQNLLSFRHLVLDIASMSSGPNSLSLAKRHGKCIGAGYSDRSKTNFYRTSTIMAVHEANIVVYAIIENSELRKLTNHPNFLAIGGITSIDVFKTSTCELVDEIKSSIILNRNILRSYNTKNLVIRGSYIGYETRNMHSFSGDSLLLNSIIKTRELKSFINSLSRRNISTELIPRDVANTATTRFSDEILFTHVNYLSFFIL